MRYLQRQRMHTSSIASNRLIASVKFNLGDGGEFDRGEKSEDEEDDVDEDLEEYFIDKND